MKHTLPRAATVGGMLALAILITAASQGAKFPGGVFKAFDGTDNIALDFDSTGALIVYVNDEAFAHGSWQAKADTLTIGKTEAPEGYACASEARYLWSLADNRLQFSMVATDDCMVRRDTLLGLVWTKG